MGKEPGTSDTGLGKTGK